MSYAAGSPEPGLREAEPGRSGVPPLRRHQREALEALEAAWAEGATRAWVVLPPGAGKTRVGLEAVLRLPEVTKAVVLGPNTAIQAQWELQATRIGLAASGDRDLTTHLTALTYQALAVFDPDAEVDDDGEDTSLLARLHDNGRALVDKLRAAGPILLVLDECHHLIEVWGRLLQELLDELPEALVLGLTATPPEALTGEQALLVHTLFGEAVHAVSIPAAVREGDLAPFAELVWLTTPTAREREWLRSEGERFRELVAQLLDPTFGSTPFLTWLDLRFLQADVPWPELQRKHPDLCDAALRMHHHGLLALPPGARLGEQHRHAPTPDDWVALVDDWLTRCLVSEADRTVHDAVRRALPSVGYQLTRRGIRRGRTPVDRVLARSAAKTGAAVEIVGHEHRALGDRMRTLVLCDHERASAVLPVDLQGVLDQQEGSAHAVLAGLVGDPVTAGLGPLMVTGRTVAGAPGTLARLRDFAQEAGSRRAAELVVLELGDGLASLIGPWSSRSWVRHVTGFFQAGHCQVLVGTRALLGEGWDANRITGVVDLTGATTTTAVVQTRGRALRTDPAWREKVALNWSVTCVADDHPKAHNDWDRLVRKHHGFLAVDADGDVVDGVAHIDPALSPFAPPPSEEFDAINARMLLRAQDRPGIRERWHIGQAYDDRHAHTLRVQAPETALAPVADPSPVVVAADGQLVLREGAPQPRRPLAAAAVGLLAGAGVVVVLGWSQPWAWLVAFVGAVLAAVLARRTAAAHQRALAEVAGRPVGIGQLARAVADALHETGQASLGAGAVRVDIDHDGRYRCHLDGVPEAESALFTQALDEVLSPIAAPRYVVPRHRLGTGPEWYAVPAALGRRGADARAFARAWSHWVGPAEPVWTRSPEGAGVLAAHAGADRMQVSTAVRRHWG